MQKSKDNKIDKKPKLTVKNKKQFNSLTLDLVKSAFRNLKYIKKHSL